MEQPKGREAQIINERKKKIEELKKEGINPYPAKFKFQEKRILSSEIKEEFSKLKNEEKSKKEKVIAGRIMTKRSFGKLNFASLQDQEGIIQIVVQKGESPEETVKKFKQMDSGDFVSVNGKVTKTKTGEISIMAKEITILTKAVLPLPDKHKGFQDKEERYRKRYLDLVMNPEIKKVFDTRAKIIAAIREYLTGRGYTEVETPILQPIYGGTSAKPFESKLNALDMKVYMRISNEMYLKRLIGGGYEKIFEFSRDFRNEGIDATHNPEFTLMETMCAYADYKENMDTVEEMLEFAAKKATGSTKVEYQGKTIDFKRPWKRITLVESLKKYAKLDVEKMSDEDLKKELKKHKIEIPIFKRGCAIEELFGELVEHQLIQPTIVYDYPFETCGLAKPKAEDPRYTERFEPYINGWEIGNIYSELNDPQVLENYWKEQEKGLSMDEESQRMDEDFLNMLKVGMPPTSGVGIGIDRLVMLLTNQPSIRDVLLFPFMKPLDYKENTTGKSKNSKIAVAVVNKDLKLKDWEKMNTVAHLNAAFGARKGKELIMQDQIETKDGERISLNIQHAIMIKEGKSNEIKDLVRKAKENELEIAEFTREMIETTDDRKVAEKTKGKNLRDIEYLGLLIFGKKSLVEKLTKNFELYK
jgi:lysyl-tRNA synthetase class 2